MVFFLICNCISPLRKRKQSFFEMFWIHWKFMRPQAGVRGDGEFCRKNRFISDFSFPLSAPIHLFSHRYLICNCRSCFFLQKTGIVSHQMPWTRGDICHSYHCRRQCKIFASGVNFSKIHIFSRTSSIQISGSLHFCCVNFLAWKSGSVKFVTNILFALDVILVS